MEDYSSLRTPLIEHCREVKRRLIYTIFVFIVSFVFAYLCVEDIYQILLRPLIAQWSSPERHMIYTNLAEIFFSYLKLAYYIALMVTIPFFICQIYIFIAPALYKNEKKAFLPFVIFSPVLFLIGGLFVYYLIFPLAWNFFLSFETSHHGLVPIKLEARVSEYLNLVVNLILAFGLAFQLPILLTLLAKIGLIDANWLRKKRRIAIVAIFIFSAIFTPPDAISQIGLAIPMLILYELSIIACQMINLSKN